MISTNCKELPDGEDCRTSFKKQWAKTNEPETNERTKEITRAGHGNTCSWLLGRLRQKYN